ncbi:O-antigen ligase family protein [Vampirovibrio sp.]|uniref:O-antigen ligase family protein n=1 Tax=Vampirovibrio sp. TaxID=2717857 RepID=UPI003592F5B1
MNFPQVQTNRKTAWPPIYYLVLALVCGLLGCTLYIWLPESLAGRLSVPLILGLSLLICGVVFYTGYVRGCLRKPVLFLLCYLALLPWFTWVTKLASALGINFPQTVNMVFLLVIPVIALTRRRWFALFKQVALIRYFSLFLLIVLVNYLFFDHVVYDKGVAIGKASMSVHYLTPLVLNFFSLYLTAYVVYFTNHPEKLIQKLNIVVVTMTLLLSVFALICYPLNIMTMFIEGMMRMQLIFFHPNNFAIYQSYLLLYLLGVYLSHEAAQFSFRWVLIVTLVLGFLALLTTLCKTAIFAVLLGGALMFLLNCRTINQFKKMLFTAISLTFIFGLAGVLLQLSMGVDSVEKINDRLNDNRSVEWRQKSWDYLLENIHGMEVVTGHGMSAAYERMIQHSAMQGHTDQVAEVHNDYLQGLYDFGIIGWILFLGLIITTFRLIASLFKTQPHPLSRFLNLTALGLLLIFFISCGTSNCIVMLETPFWILLLTTIEAARRLNAASVH